MSFSYISPKVSIITVTFNAEKQLERTIQSVIGQTYKNIEYLVIDGLSTDGTIDIVKKYESNIQFWLSEPDKGIYDAMNKGMAKATGDYIWFLNAGDEIFSAQTLESVMTLSPGMDFYYGETMLIDQNGKNIGIRSKMTSQEMPVSLTWKEMKHGMVISHQSIIVKRSVSPPYDLAYQYSADIDWTIRCLKKSVTIINTELILSSFMANRVLGKFHAGGESKKHLWVSLRERFRLLKAHFGLPMTLWYHISISFKALRFFLRLS